MLKALLPAALLAAGALIPTVLPSANASSQPNVVGAVPAIHCQVPCGIYTDKMRVEMLLEDAATIEKAMTTLVAMDAEAAPSKNQMVRWVMTKEQHAQNIQDRVASYWLAQRIKAPKAGASAEDTAAYYQKLGLMHGITVAAMKCKQTTDASHVAKLRELSNAFSAAYFSPEDLKHEHKDH